MSSTTTPSPRRPGAKRRAGFWRSPQGERSGGRRIPAASAPPAATAKPRPRRPPLRSPRRERHHQVLPVALALPLALSLPCRRSYFSPRRVDDQVEVTEICSRTPNQRATIATRSPNEKDTIMTSCKRLPADSLLSWQRSLQPEWVLLTSSCLTRRLHIVAGGP